MPGRTPSKKPFHNYVTSNKGKSLLIIDDFIYQQSKVTPNVTYWICKIKDCNARAHTKTNTGELIKQTGGDQKKKTKTALALEARLKTLGTRFENGQIDRKQYLEALSFVVVNKNKL